MIKYFTFFLIFISIFGHSQINKHFLINEWIVTKTLMLDGSKDLTQPDLQSKFQRWRISGEKICMDSNPVESNVKNCLDYHLTQNFMQTSSQSGYEIEKLTQDSLVLIQRIEGIVDADKINRYWLTKSTVLKENYIDQHKSDSIIIATEHFTPTFKQNLSKAIMDEFKNKSKFPNFKLIGNLVFYPEAKKLEMEIVNSGDKEVVSNKKNIYLIKSIIEQTSSNWNLADFQKFKKVYLPFVLDCFSFTDGPLYSKGSRINYFETNTDYLKSFAGRGGDKFKSDESFENGVKAVQNKNLEKALKYFVESYNLNPRKVDALYNIANIYAYKGDKVNECRYLKKLKELGQAEGTKNYEMKCWED